MEPGAELPAWPLSNVWIGVSIEDQVRADERLPLLLDCPAAVRFVSAEPLIRPVSLSLALGQNGGKSASDLASSGLHWVIVGGESGDDARPMHPDWARSLRDECVGASIKFFFKQIGEWSWERHPGEGYLCEGIMHDGRRVSSETPGSQTVVKIGADRTGKLLDGLVWQEFPAVPVPLSARKPPKRKGKRRVSGSTTQTDLFGQTRVSAATIQDRKIAEILWRQPKAGIPAGIVKGIMVELLAAGE